MSRDFGGALDHHLTPPDPPEDLTENLSPDDFARYLMLWFDHASSSQQSEVTDWINERILKEMDEYDY